MSSRLLYRLYHQDRFTEQDDRQDVGTRKESTVSYAMSDYKVGFRLFISDGRLDECVNEEQRVGYRCATELYDKLLLQSLVMEPRDINKIINMLVGC